MSEIHPASEAFEMLKWFCFRIGEGRLEPREDDGIHYILLYHPVVDNEYLLVHYNKANQRIYVREFVEEKSLDELPLVHSFNSFIFGSKEENYGIFPFAVDLHEDKATYHYRGEGIIKVPLAQYRRFNFLFDGRNPIPWTESDLR